MPLTPYVTLRDYQTVSRLKLREPIRVGGRTVRLRYPVITVAEARRAGLPLSVAIAALEKESGGGRNVYGHDAGMTLTLQGRRVTRRNYLHRYLPARNGSKGPDGIPRVMQGVGPMQLTWYTFQDRADAIGGCWLPWNNIRVGFEIIAGYLTQHGSVREAGRRYNGADLYGVDLENRDREWRAALAAR
jgi:hypothetical protein